ncbi:MAG TPA: dienelactone hydrolase family protein [Candidatus Binatia bacterium]|nr:dienelactone hydrolase family protein [Candidatus Binatia bacterium]
MERREETISGHDGHKFGGWLVVPDRGSGPGMVVCQEIFGITDYIKGVCERLAGLGYVALAPELYSRIEPSLVLDERETDNLPRALQAGQQLDFAQAVDDTVAALEHLRGVPEVERGRVGVIGFCLGGGLAFLAAAADDPSIAVCYYGSAIPNALDRVPQVTCPAIFHFGAEDNYISAEQRQAVERAFAGRDAEFHLHPGAGHAFDNHNSPIFSRPEAAAPAWAQTVDFLARRFPPAG